MLVFGSDWPVVTSDPYLGMWGALCRKPGEPGEMSHTQTLDEVIRSYTCDAAWTEFQEDVKGQIKVGMLADLVLLSDDLFAIEHEAVKDVLRFKLHATISL